MEVINFLSDFWSEWQDLNLRPPRPERVLSPTALLWLLFRQCLLHNLEATSSSMCRTIAKTSSPSTQMASRCTVEIWDTACDTNWDTKAR
jgi:hypothetical protein